MTRQTEAAGLVWAWIVLTILLPAAATILAVV